MPRKIGSTKDKFNGQRYLNLIKSMVSSLETRASDIDIESEVRQIVLHQFYAKKKTVKSISLSLKSHPDSRYWRNVRQIDEILLSARKRVEVFESASA